MSSQQAPPRSTPADKRAPQGPPPDPRIRRTEQIRELNEVVRDQRAFELLQSTAELERQTKALMELCSHTIGNVQSQMHAMSGITLQAVEILASAAEKANAQTTKAIDEAHEFLLTADQISASMEPVIQLAEQIKDVRRTLTVLEAACE
ncbi:hypothetical protein H696_00408 [Fonticula alba]|uniref:BLOC-1-related complex subunit 6 C-terminal helix domain-containing protein n=1 Tax=Fonticula alba TaxID=691883 RepID=A0A058ZH72_FONAL|nr:hypothetical protein H696_00408 [Fonticula alba]KCV72832.1 hypothetical protein H696_00408 [Fonticula alba]|eukprot:XP_009492533.1 hypothetical protein H696_00408 [Fonticula alba]